MLQLVKCGCTSSGCKKGRCSCLTEKLLRTDLCMCTGCENTGTVEPEKEPERDEDDDDDEEEEMEHSDE